MVRKLEGSLKVFTELRTMLLKDELGPRAAMTPDYKNLYYDCGCGEQHILSQTKHVLCAKPVKFFFICDNNICSLVRVKGFFRQTSQTEWYVESDEFKDGLTQFVEIDEKYKVLYDPTTDAL